MLYHIDHLYKVSEKSKIIWYAIETQIYGWKLLTIVYGEEISNDWVDSYFEIFLTYMMRMSNE
jgi:hypothetical protein